MLCPSCNEYHDPKSAGRFCASCGMAVGPPPKAKVKVKADEEPAPNRCAECGRIIEVGAGRCPFCGARQKGTALP